MSDKKKTVKKKKVSRLLRFGDDGKSLQIVKRGVDKTRPKPLI